MRLWKLLKNLDKDSEKEIELVDAFEEYMKEEKIYAYEFDGIRFDLGSIKGFALATIHYALQNEEIKDDIKKHILEVVEVLK